MDGNLLKGQEGGSVGAEGLCKKVAGGRGCISHVIEFASRPFGYWNQVVFGLMLLIPNRNPMSLAEFAVSKVPQTMLQGPPYSISRVCYAVSVSRGV
jgi:hypothetical protein